MILSFNGKVYITRPNYKGLGLSVSEQNAELAKYEAHLNEKYGAGKWEYMKEPPFSK